MPGETQGTKNIREYNIVSCHKIVQMNNDTSKNSNVRNAINELIKDTKESSLIIVLGEQPRLYVETELKNVMQDAEIQVTFDVIRHIHEDIKVLFLNRLQYLFMYLTHLEVDEANSQYNNIILYGLDNLLIQTLSQSSKSNDDKKIEIIRLSQLILNCFYSLKRNHHFDIHRLISIPWGKNTTENDFSNLELQIDDYCQYIN